MNFLCHALPYLDSPLVAIATGVPDWLSVTDRRIRARRKLAAPWINDADEDLAAVAQGILHHIDDDRWFHGTAAFAQTNLEMAVQLRDQLPGDEGFRPTFVGHILIEMMLDWFWIRDDAEHARRYFNSFDATTAERVQRCVNQITGKPTERLASVIERFVETKFLYDYGDDESLMMRLNQVMNRVKLPALPDALRGWLPAARNLVESRRSALLTPPDAAPWYCDPS